MPDNAICLRPHRAILLTLQLVGLQLGFGLAIGFVLVFANMAAGHKPEEAPIGSPLIIAVGNLLAFGFILWRESRAGRTAWRGFFRNSERLAPLLSPFLLCAVGGVMLCSEFDNLLRTLLPVPKWLGAFFGQLADLGTYPWSTPFALVVVAPLTEELLFRGLILRGLLGVTTPARAIVLSAVLFMAMHLNPWQFPTALALGLLYGWIYLRTRSLTLCIAGHAFNNACVLLAPGLPFVIHGFNTPADAGGGLQPWWFDLAGLVATGLGIALFRRRTPAPAAAIPPVLPPPPPPQPDAAT